MSNAEIELLVLTIRNEIEDLYYSKEFKEKILQDATKSSLEKSLKENKISSTDYQKALDISSRYEINSNQV